MAAEITAELTEDKQAYIFPCPWCRLMGCESQIFILLNEVACRRMIHGVVKSSGIPLGPHSGRGICEAHIKENLIWGCGRAIELLPPSTEGKIVVTAREYES